MREKEMGYPLDLNNFPDDFIKDHGKQTLDDSPSSASGIMYRKKKNGSKDESGKVYECRFCSLKFCKSQALGGHMNRHRQERMTEALNHARQLVFSNDNLLHPLHHQLGGQQTVHGGFYPTKHFSYTSTTVPPAPPPHMYTSAASHLNNPYSSHPLNYYSVGHVCFDKAPSFTLQNLNSATAPPPENANNYKCIGAPLGQRFTHSDGSGGREMS